MAKKDETKIILERTYNVPLRSEFLKAPRYKRAKKASTALREFLQKHMKSEDVKIGKHLNMEIWKDGIKNPPHHVKVHATKNEAGQVKAEIVGAPLEEKKETAPKAKSTEDSKKAEIEAKKAQVAEEVKKKLAQKKAAKETDTKVSEEKPTSPKAQEETDTKASEEKPTSPKAQEETDTKASEEETKLAK